MFEDHFPLNEEEKKQAKTAAKGILGCFFAFVLLIVLFCSIYTVDEGERGVVTTFGEVSSVSDAGIHMKLPFVQSVYFYSTRVQKASFNDLTAYSHDQQIIENYKISITWQYKSDAMKDIYTRFGTKEVDDIPSIFITVIGPQVQQRSKTILGQFTAQTIIQDRLTLEKTIETKLKEDLATYPIQILGIQLEDVNFSKSYEVIVEQTAQKKMEIDKARNELQKVELESQQKVKQAQADNQAIKLRADADAYRIESVAKAEAQAIRIKAEALARNPDIIKLNAIEKWNGNVPTTVLNDSVPLLNLK